MHCIVTAGALDFEGKRWTPTRRGWLSPPRRTAGLFAATMLHGLEPLLAEGEVHLPPGLRGARLLRMLRRKKWVVFAKRPFKTSAHLIDYLGRYTHRVAISDSRVLAVHDGGLTFRTRNDDTCTLDDVTFVHRFLQHILPRGFRKIRHYGLYAPSSVRGRLETARAMLEPVESPPDDEQPEGDAEDTDWRERLRELTGQDLRRCSACGAHAVVVEPLGRRPPAGWPTTVGRTT